MGQLLMRKNVRSFEIASLHRNGILYFLLLISFFHLIISFAAAVGAANFETFLFRCLFFGHQSLCALQFISTQIKMLKFPSIFIICSSPQRSHLFTARRMVEKVKKKYKI